MCCSSHLADRGSRHETKNARVEQHDNASTLVTPLTWQTVLAMALPYMGAYVRAVAPSSPPPEPPSPPETGATEGSGGRALIGPESKMATAAARRVEEDRVERGRALMRTRRVLLEQEHHALGLRDKALLLEVCGGVARTERGRG